MTTAPARRACWRAADGARQRPRRAWVFRYQTVIDGVLDSDSDWA